MSAASQLLLGVSKTLEILKVGMLFNLTHKAGVTRSDRWQVLSWFCLNSSGNKELTISQNIHRCTSSSGNLLEGAIIFHLNPKSSLSLTGTA